MFLLKLLTESTSKVYYICELFLFVQTFGKNQHMQRLKCPLCAFVNCLCTISSSDVFIHLFQISVIKIFAIEPFQVIWITTGLWWSVFTTDFSCITYYK